MNDISVVVPYRDRADHLERFVPAIIGAIPGVELLIVEQGNDKPFNRGALCNVGFIFSSHSHIIFHDVDMIPEDVDYSPQNGATHLATAASQFEYNMPYLNYFGGVTMFDRNSFEACNGFPANYYGWGLEDDALLDRAQVANVDVNRRMGQRFESLPHERPHGEKPPKENIDIHFKHLGSKLALMTSGLLTMSYSLQSVTNQDGYTHIVADI